MRILIVDDSPDDRLLLKTILGKAGHRDLLLAASPDEAFRLLGMGAAAAPATAVDLILMDVMMPQMDGIEACTILKTEPGVRDIPVIMVTGKSEAQDLKAAFSAGAIDYIAKPYNKLELEARVNSALAIQRAQQELRQSEKRMRDITSALGEGVYVLDAAGRVTFMNPEAERLLGWSEAELAGCHIHEVIHFRRSDGSRVAEEECAVLATLRRGEPFRCEDDLFVRKDGSTFPVSHVSAPIIDDGVIAGSVTAFQDITERKRAEEGLRLAASVLENSLEGIIVTDPRGVIETVNPAFTTFTGYSPDEVRGHTPALLKSGRQGPEFYEQMWETLRATGQWQGEIWNRHKNGEIYPEWLSISAIKDSRGRVSRYVGIFSDISALKLAEQRLEHLATHDMLTGLPNRVLLMDRLNQALARARRQKRDMALFFIDLDRFKPINDTFGHEAGDAVLQEVAWRLKNCVRETDTVARMGGDEFVVVLQDVEGEADAATVAEKMLSSLADPVTVGRRVHSIGGSIGISLYSKNGDDADELIANADVAMYRVKETGRNHYAFHHQLERERLDV